MTEDEYRRRVIASSSHNLVGGNSVPIQKVSMTKTNTEAVEALAKLLREEHWRIDQGYYKSVAMAVLTALTPTAKTEPSATGLEGEECLNCGWQGPSTVLDAGVCPECGGECVPPSEIYADETSIWADAAWKAAQEAYGQHMGMPEESDIDTGNRAAAQAIEQHATTALSAPTREREARPLEEWHEDMGDVVWWTFPVTEAAMIGSPLDTAWPGYHTHWTPHPPIPGNLLNEGSGQ